jgi:hypothetical protein
MDRKRAISRAIPTTFSGSRTCSVDKLILAATALVDSTVLETASSTIDQDVFARAEAEVKQEEYLKIDSVTYWTLQ